MTIERNSGDLRDLQNVGREGGATAEELHLFVLTQIRDTLTAQAKSAADHARQTSDILARVIGLEQREERYERMDRTMERLEVGLRELRDQDNRREGASNVFSGFRGWVPVIIAIGTSIASIFSATYLAGRATGIVQAPPTHVAAHP